MTVIKYAVELASFDDLSNLNYIRIEDNIPIFGLEIKRSYKNPPGSLVGLLGDPKGKSLEYFRTYEANINTAMEYWEAHKLLES